MQVNIKLLKAIRISAYGGEVRYYLKGVFIEPMDGFVRMSATNGHMLLTAKQVCSDANKDCPSFIMPSSLIDKIKLDKRSEPFGNVTFEQGKITIEYFDTVVSTLAIDGTFPDIKYVIPKKVNGESAHYNFDYLMNFNKAAKIIGGTDSPQVFHNGFNPALVNLGAIDNAEWLGVIMPFKSKFEEPTTNWL